IATNFAASNSGSGNVVRFLNATGYTVATVTGVAGTCFATDTTGAASNNGDITLSDNAGTLALNAAVNAGTGTARLSSAGQVKQTSAGIITAANLGVRAAGAITLDQAVNAVSTVFAANDSASGTVIRFQNNNLLTTGTVNGVAGTSFATTTIGVVSTN